MELGKFIEETVNELASAKTGGKATVPVTFDLAVAPDEGKVHVIKGQPSSTPLRLSFTVQVIIGAGGQNK